MTNFDEMRSGQNGLHIETGTSAVTGNFGALYIVEAATFTTLTMPGNEGDAGTGFAWPADRWIYGEITAFTMSSGKVIAYKN